MKKPKGFVDVHSEIQQKKKQAQETKEFFEYLDNEHLKAKVYILAVMGHFQCNASQAGEHIAKHLKGEF